MKNVAFVISKNGLNNWNGGISYFKNLIKLVSKIKNIKIKIFTDDKQFIRDEISGKVNILYLGSLNYSSIKFYLRKIIIFIFKKDYILFNELKKNNINVLSHRRLFLNNQIKSFGWIPDLQHKVYKNFFPLENFNIRENYILDEIKNSNKIFVSSLQIKKEFNKFYKLKDKILALRIPSHKKIKKLKIKNNKEFNILFPSQLWKHKNHILLVYTARELKLRKFKCKFILTGSVSDHRFKNNYKTFLNEIQKHNVGDYFKILGEVSSNKLTKLQNSCSAMINPSLYEGWSTINEEARSLSKFIFLSNIPGHKEQQNSYSIYFEKNNSKQLAKKIINFYKSKNFYKKKFLNNKNKNFVKKIEKETISLLKDLYFQI